MRVAVIAAITCFSLLGACLAAGANAADRKSTSIPAGPLGRALQALAQDRNLQIAYVTDDVASITTPGASGDLTTDETLTQLLRGTGLTYKHSAENDISVVPATTGTAPVSPGVNGPTTPASENANTAEQKARRSFWSRFRVAQLDHGKAASGSGGGQSANEADRQADGSADGALQEVVITAQRRSENMQRVPIAASAFQGGDLRGKAVTNLNDLQYASPSLSIGNAGLSNSVNIRGVGLASGSPAVANGVAVYVDGLFQTPTVNSNQFFDIADVEVLRGPQGTLVGANSTGGAIFINSRSPKIDGTESYVQAGGGNYHAWNAQGAINVPVNDELALRLAGEFTQHESFYASIGPAYANSGSLYEAGVRLGVLFKPGPFQVLGKFEFVHRNTGGYAATAVPGTKYAPFAPADPFVLDYDTPGNLNREHELTVNVELRYEFVNGLTLRSQSGYIDKPVRNFEDYDGTSVNTPATPRLTYDQNVRGQQWTQEINLLSPVENHFNWVVGGYFARNNINVNIYETGTTGPNGPALYIYSPQKKKNTGWFGQLNFKTAPRWELQTGVRYSTYSATSSGFTSLLLPVTACGNGAPPPAPWNGCKVGSTSGEASDGRLTGKVALNYFANDDNLLYAFIARGYKPGGFNSPTAAFGPETVWDYELGWKSSLLNNHVRTQLGGFYYQYHDFQFQELQLSTGTVGVTNLPTATLNGIEASVQARVTQWGADAGVGYVHSKLPNPRVFVNNHLLPPAASSLPQCQMGTHSSGSCFDYSPYLTATGSGPNLYSPQWTYNLGVQYEMRLPGSASLTPRLNYAYVGSQFTSLTYSRVTDYLPAHGLLAGLLTLRWSRNWAAEGYGNNLTNKVYRSGEGLNSGNYYFYGAPREYGVRASFTY